MDPLANTDLQTYIENLVDHHLPDRGDHDKDSTSRPKGPRKRSGGTARPTGDEIRKEKRKRAE